MATLTNEQIEQKMQLLAEKLNEMNVISDELKNCGREMLSDEDLDLISGGSKIGDFFKKIRNNIVDFMDYLEGDNMKGKHPFEIFKD